MYLCGLRLVLHLKYIISTFAAVTMWDVDVIYSWLFWDGWMLFNTCVNTRHTQVYDAWLCISVLVHKGSINVSHDYVHLITYTVPTCSQKAMGSKQQLWRDLYFGFALVFKSRKVSLVLIGCHLFPGPIIRWNGKDEFIKVVLLRLILKWMKRETN